MIPMQRFGLPNDISCAAMYLSSDAGQYITGSNIVIDGGVYMTFPNWQLHDKNIQKVWS